jgi:hypothetical protein
MIYFKKLFKFPGPKELGMSDSNNAMPSRFFPNNKTEITWEDYYEYLAKTYPVKYFLAAVFPQFFRDCWRKLSRPFRDAHYWLACHLLPSKRYHWLDLRQPKGYRYGWCDTDRRMVYAMMNLLVEYVEKEMPHGYFVPSEEEAALDDGVTCGNYSGFKRQLENHKEYMTIYNWWTKERAVELEEEGDKCTAWSDARHVWADNTELLWAELKVLTERNEAKLEEMLHRLLKIRHCLWT